METQNLNVLIETPNNDPPKWNAMPTHCLTPDHIQERYKSLLYHHVNNALTEQLDEIAQERAKEVVKELLQNERLAT